jgi:hypothetical protein
MRLIVDTSVGSVVIGSPPHDGAVWRSFCLGTAVDAMGKIKEMRIRHTPEGLPDRALPPSGHRPVHQSEVTPGYDETAIDLHLGPIDAAKSWDLGTLTAGDAARGGQAPEIHLGRFDYRTMAEGHLRPVPEGEEDGEGRPRPVYRRGDEIVVRQLGFLLWTTRETVGTPEIDPASLATQRHPELICFVNAKSTKARTGLIVYFTAPTIHAGWAGNVTLEISNLGPLPSS